MEEMKLECGSLSFKIRNDKDSKEGGEMDAHPSCEGLRKNTCSPPFGQDRAKAAWTSMTQKLKHRAGLVLRHQRKEEGRSSLG